MTHHNLASFLVTASAPPRALIEDAAAPATIGASFAGIGSFGIEFGITNDRKCGADAPRNNDGRGEEEEGAEDRGGEEDADMAEERAIGADSDSEFQSHWRLEMADGAEDGVQDGEPIEDIWRLFEGVGDNSDANEPILDEEITAVMEDDDDDDRDAYDPIEDLWRLFTDSTADHESNSPVLGDDEEERTQNMAVVDVRVAQDPTQRPRAASDASGRPRASLPNDSGIESSSPQSSNFSSVDALESRGASEINADASEPDTQPHSETMSNTMPRSTRRRRANQNDTATSHTKKPRSS